MEVNSIVDKSILVNSGRVVWQLQCTRGLQWNACSKILKTICVWFIHRLFCYLFITVRKIKQMVYSVTIAGKIIPKHFNMEGNRTEGQPDKINQETYRIITIRYLVHAFFIFYNISYYTLLHFTIEKIIQTEGTSLMNSKNSVPWTTSFAYRNIISMCFILLLSNSMD